MKINKCFFMFFLLLLFSGCKGDDIRDFRHNGYTLSDKKFKCPMVKIKYLYDNFLISEDNDIYEVSYDLPYKNGFNCKIINKSYKAMSIYSDEIFKSSDNNLYSFNYNDNRNFSHMDNKFAEFLLFGDTNIKVINNDDHYFVLNSDGNIYDYILKENFDNEHSINLINSSILYKNDDFDGDIVDFYYSDNLVDNYVRTTTNYYTSQLVDESCLKFADIKCEYELKVDKILNKYNSNVVAFNGRTLILKSGKVLEKNVNTR